jgi:serine protease
MVQSRLVPVLLTFGLAGCSASPLLDLGTDPTLVPDAGPDVLEGTYLVYTDDGTPPDAVAAALEDGDLSPAWQSDLRDGEYGGAWRLTSSADWDTVYMAGALDDAVVDIEPERWVMPSALPPNDPYFSYQWHLSAVGIPGAWDYATGEGVVVAVIDTGVSEGRDGFGRLLDGYDFIDGDARPDDPEGHGTHVAGTVAQATGNGFGTAGVAPGASILPVRVLGARGGSMTTVADGIVYAVDEGADVINLSLGSGGATRLLYSAIEYAERNGVVVVGASGNAGAGRVDYPAAFDMVLAVGATDALGQVTRYSNEGNALDLVAPGGDTGADATGDGYSDGVLQETYEYGSLGFRFYEGTSMAAPHVAGAAALLVEMVGNNPGEIRELLTASARDIGRSGYDTSSGWGELDIEAAVALASGSAIEAPTDTAPETPDEAYVISARGDGGLPIEDLRTTQSDLSLGTCDRIEDLLVDVDIRHSWRGDLVVALVSPEGEQVVLHNRTDGGADDIVGSYGISGGSLESAESLERLVGSSGTGGWSLFILDEAEGDTGTLVAWTLTALCR